MLTRFRLSWKNYVFQSFLATLSIFLVLLFLNIEHAVVIAAIGASAFIVFVMPDNVTARSRNIICGHISGFFIGSLCALIPQLSPLCSVTVYSLAVGLSIFIMIITNTGHPPAAATALGVAIMGFTPPAIIAVITSVVVLSVAHHFLKPFLRNLI